MHWPDRRRLICLYGRQNQRIHIFEGKMGEGKSTWREVEDNITAAATNGEPNERRGQSKRRTTRTIERIRQRGRARDTVPKRAKATKEGSGRTGGRQKKDRVEKE